MENIIKLTQRNYLGKGWVHYFRNNEDNLIKVVECTKEEYEELGGENKNGNPVLEGYTWIGSEGEVVKVDSENLVLLENEYTLIGDVCFIVFKNSDGFIKGKFIKSTKIIDDQIDKSELADNKMAVDRLHVNEVRDNFEEI